MAQSIIAATTTAASQGFATWSDNILVDAGAIAATTILYITTDGSVPTNSNFNYAIPGGQVAIVANHQPKLNGLQYAGHGGLDDAGGVGPAGSGNNGNGYGVTSQTVPAALWTSGFPTYISILSSTALAGNVGVEQR